MGRLYDSAITYAKLHKDIVFEMELGNNIDGIKKVVLNFPSENYRHFIGVDKEHISDLDHYTTEIKPKAFYDGVRRQRIDETHISMSVDFNNPLNSNTKNGVQYFLTDRFATVANLYKYLHNSDESNMKVYLWERDIIRKKKDKNGIEKDVKITPQRPQNSTIDADLMICFSEVLNKKDNEEKAHIFFKCDNKSNSNDTQFYPISGFPTNLDYTKITNTLSLSSYEILSMTEFDKVTNRKIELIKAPQEKIEKYKAIAEKRIADRAARVAQIDSNVEAIKKSAGKSFTDLSGKREKFLDKLTKIKKNKKKNKDWKELNEYKDYVDTKESLVQIFKNKTSAWKEEFMTRLCSSFTGSHNDKKDLIRDEINSFDPEGEYSKKYLSFSHNISIDASGAIAIAPAVAVPLSERWNNFNENLQQALRSFTDDVKLTFQSLGSDIRKIGSDIKDFFTNTTKSDVKQSGKHKVADRPAKVEKPVEARTEKIDRSNKPNLSAVMESKKKEAAKYNKERTVSPQQHKKNKGRDDI